QHLHPLLVEGRQPLGSEPVTSRIEYWTGQELPRPGLRARAPAAADEKHHAAFRNVAEQALEQGLPQESRGPGEQDPLVRQTLADHALPAPQGEGLTTAFVSTIRYILPVPAPSGKSGSQGGQCS